MGVEFIATKSKPFKHRRDAKFAEKIQSANLLSGVAEKTTHQFRCKAEGDVAPEVGMRVLLYQEGTKINVLYQNKKIGVVMSRMRRRSKDFGSKKELKFLRRTLSMFVRLRKYF